MDGQLVLREDSEAICWLTLSRPGKLNAITATMLRQLRHHLERVSQDDSVRCVVLRGAGRSFSAGKDLDDVRGSSSYDPDEDASTVDFLEALPQPTIAAIHGPCFTGGLELALACDLLVAADDARIADTHARWGITPLWGMSVRLPERIGTARAKRIMFTSCEVSGTQAAEIGLVDESVPAEQLEETVTRLARAIAAGSSDSNRIAKRLLASSPMKDARPNALEWERSRPFGVPQDRAVRLTASTLDSKHPS